MTTDDVNATTLKAKKKKKKNITSTLFLEIVIRKNLIKIFTQPHCNARLRPCDAKFVMFIVIA